MCDKTQNFSLSIKLVDKNHIIYNKKVTNTQNLFNLMKEKKNYLQGCRQGREEKGRIQQILYYQEKDDIRCKFIYKKYI